MKATQLLKKDHDAVKKLFADFLDTTDRAPKKREELCEKIATELEIHAQMEEEIFYPAMQEFPEAADLLEEAHDEHDQVKSLVSEIEEMDVSDSAMTDKMNELQEKVLHHASEEEKEMFPMAEDKLGADRLSSLGEQLDQRKKQLKKGAMGRQDRAA